MNLLHEKIAAGCKQAAHLVDLSSVNGSIVMHISMCVRAHVTQTLFNFMHRLKNEAAQKESSLTSSMLSCQAVATETGKDFSHMWLMCSLTQALSPQDLTSAHSRKLNY